MKWQAYFKYKNDGEGFYMKTIHAINCETLKNEEKIPYRSDDLIIMDVQHQEIIGIRDRMWIELNGFKKTQKEAFEFEMKKVKEEIEEDEILLNEKKKIFDENIKDPNWTCPYCAYVGCEYCLQDNYILVHSEDEYKGGEV